MKSILIAGYYGAGNVGDEAILSSILSCLKEEQSDVNITVCSWQPESTQELHSVKAISWTKMSIIAETVSDMDLVIVGGGGLFQDYWGLDPDTYLRSTHGGISTYGSLILLAELFGIPCILLGVGIGPLHSRLGRQHTLELALRCQAIVLRDQESYQELLRCGFSPDDPEAPAVSISADLTFLFESSTIVNETTDDLISQVGIEAGTPLLGINLRYWDRPEPPSVWLPIIVEGVREFLKYQEKYQVVLLPFQKFNESAFTDDVQVCEDFIELMGLPERIHLVRDVGDPEIMRSLIGKCSHILGMRYHAVIFALLNHIPPVALSYDPKVEHLMKEAGLKTVCPLFDLKTNDQMKSLLLFVVENRTELSSLIGSFLEDQKKLTQGPMDVLSEVLSRPIRKQNMQVLQKRVLKQIQVMERMDQEFDQVKGEFDELIREKESQQSVYDQLVQDMQLIKQSRTYQLAENLQKFRNWILPPQSKRGKFYTQLVDGSRKEDVQ